MLWMTAPPGHDHDPPPEGTAYGPQVAATEVEPLLLMPGIARIGAIRFRNDLAVDGCLGNPTGYLASSCSSVGPAPVEPTTGVLAAAAPATTDGSAAHGTAAGMSDVGTLLMSVVVDLMVDLAVGMDLGMPDLGVDPHDLGGRCETDGARGDPHFQPVPSAGVEDSSCRHGVLSFSGGRRIEQSPPRTPCPDTRIERAGKPRDR